jgi:hypothetical protein
MNNTSNKTYTLYNTESKETVIMTLSEILQDINRDRSEDWTDYNETDWEEGLEHFTEYTLIR